jgi:ssDNA-binding Zn-finger/Zn-ribbon topoisomerase 1
LVVIGKVHINFTEYKKLILKEKQLTISKDPKIRAGEDAEKQMAFYLKRTFGKTKDCYVLNDVYICHDGENAQIDHLIVTQFGLFIIESKSVHGTISINKLNEWSRTYNNKPEGMRSPVTQAEEQGKIIKECIIANREKLRSKLLGLQKGFRHCPIIVYVAISDTGIIDRKTTIAELFKADQVCKAIEEKLKELRKLASLLSFSLEGGWTMSNEEAKNVAEFLMHQHLPKKIETKPVASTTKLAFEEMFIPKTGATCPKCNKHKLIRKSVTRSDGTETDFLVCAAYPKECKAIFPLVAVAKKVDLPESKIENKNELKANDNCPQCSIGKLVSRKKKTEFLGCSQYPKCNYTSYRNNV